MQILVYSLALLSVCIFTAIRLGPDLNEYACPVWHSGWLRLNQRRWSSCRRWHWLSGGEYETNLTIANVKTLSHDDNNSHSFSSDGQEHGGIASCCLLDLLLLPCATHCSFNNAPVATSLSVFN